MLFFLKLKIDPMHVMSYILSAHINFYFIISTMFNFLNSPWGHSCLKTHSYYFIIWFSLKFIVIWIIKKLTMLMLNMIFINFKFIYNFEKLTIMIILTIPLNIFYHHLKMVKIWWWKHNQRSQGCLESFSKDCTWHMSLLHWFKT
jgi:hypothetical protein